MLLERQKGRPDHLHSPQTFGCILNGLVFQGAGQRRKDIFAGILEIGVGADILCHYPIHQLYVCKEGRSDSLKLLFRWFQLKFYGDFHPSPPGLLLGDVAGDGFAGYIACGGTKERTRP